MSQNAYCTGHRAQWQEHEAAGRRVAEEERDGKARSRSHCLGGIPRRE